MRLLALTTIALSLLTIGSAESRLQNKWISLFNGHDLTGWKANTNPQAFRVVDGAIRVQATGKKAAHLFYIGTADRPAWVFKNFELEATVRAEPNSNSGIFIHTGPATRNGMGHLRDGYEIQLNSSQKEKRKTGSLYAVRDLADSPVDETMWFAIHVRVKGKRIRIQIDGKLIVDYTEPKRPQRDSQRLGRLVSDLGGMIALQAHDKRSTWYFKDIRVRELK